MRDDAPASMDELEARFVEWANAREDIRAAIVVGSRARTDHPADEWADLDIGFATTDQRRYLTSSRWLSDIAPVWVWYPDAAGPTRHVLFAGGLDAGLSPISAGGIMLGLRVLPLLKRYPGAWRVVPNGTRLRQDAESAAEYYRRGCRTIIDKDGIAARFLQLFPAVEAQHDPPSSAALERTTLEFLFRAVWTAKHLRRGELWWGKTGGVDGPMKSLLLRMIEWQAHATHGAAYDTWEGGRFLEEWAHTQTLYALRDTFGHYDAADLARALITTMRAFREAGRETAKAFGLTYPEEADARVSKWVSDCVAPLRQ